LIEGEAGHFTFNEFRAEIEQLRGELQPDAPKRRLLDEVAAFGAELEAFVLSKRESGLERGFSS